MKRFNKIYLEISNVCNLSCAFCPGTKREKHIMTIDEFSALMPRLRPWADYLYFHLMGEPLLHPQLPEFLALAKSRGFTSMLTTNGTLLRQKGAALLDAGVHKVSVSVHSFEDGDTAAQQQYLSQVADFAKQATQRGTIVCLRLWNRGCDEGRNLETEAFLRAQFPDPWTENTRGYRLRDKLFLEYGDRFIWPDRENREQKGRPTCYGMRDQFGILSDGTVVPCCLDSDGVINLGNVFTQPLAQILNTDRAQRIAEGFRNRKAVEELCRRCPYANR